MRAILGGTPWWFVRVRRGSVRLERDLNLRTACVIAGRSAERKPCAMTVARQRPRDNAHGLHARGHLRDADVYGGQDAAQ